MAEHLDLLVLGSRAYGPSGRLLSGTTSTRLAPRAPACCLSSPARDLMVVSTQTGESSSISGDKRRAG